MDAAIQHLAGGTAESWYAAAQPRSGLCVFYIILRNCIAKFFGDASPEKEKNVSLLLAVRQKGFSVPT